MQLLQETFIIEQLQVLSEGKANGPMKIRGVFGRCNEKNNNGRIYPTAVLESQLAKVQPLIAERRLCGELDHPANDTVKLSNASHLITKLDMKGNELIGEAEILKTPAGLTAKALVEGGVKIGISSRGMGTLSEDQNGDKVVNEDFRLVTFDLVADPSTRGAFPGLSESTESKFVKESQSKLKKESNFVTMLESKMRDAYTPWIEEAKTKKKAATKDLPGNQEALDADNDGKIEASDLRNIRKESMDLVRKDGIWHRMAEIIAVGLGHDVSEAEAETSLTKKKVDEAFADELDKESKRSLATQNAAKDTGGMLSNFRARRHAKGMEVAASKGRVKGKGIEQKGEIKRARIGQKAQDAAAAGGPVTTGEKVVAGAGKLVGGAGKLVGGAASAAKDAGRRVAGAVQGVAGAVGGDSSASKLLDTQRSRRRIKRAGGWRDPDGAAAAPTRGAGRSEALQTDRNKLAAELRARRASGGNVGSVKGARTQGKGRLTKAHGTTEAFAYQDLGEYLAEMFNLKENATQGYSGIKGGTPQAAKKEKELENDGPRHGRESLKTAAARIKAAKEEQKDRAIEAGGEG